MLTERKIYKIKIWKRNNTYFPDGRISKRTRRNVKSGEELKLMFQRNNETEGTFGDWKS